MELSISEMGRILEDGGFEIQFCVCSFEMSIRYSNREIKLVVREMSLKPRGGLGWRY